MTERGTLILVVGSSGAGKDSVIAGAAARLFGNGRIIFAQRVITRPVCDSDERHAEISPAAFAALREAGGFMLHWRAHGFDYGVPQALTAELDAGRSVVVNVSRTIVAEARCRFPPSRSSPSQLRQRRLPPGSKRADEKAVLKSTAGFGDRARCRRVSPMSRSRTTVRST